MHAEVTSFMRKPHITVRIARAEDYLACLPLLSLLYHGDLGPNFQKVFEAYAATEEEGVILLAEQSTKPVGILVGSYHLDIDWEGRIARIDAIIVDEPFRMRGIGKNLTSCFIAMARKKQCIAVKSRVNQNNIVAQRFHRSLGFSRADTYEYILDFQEQK
jgi:ribosomal protein S18 acetylase RimI-like enzyme